MAASKWESDGYSASVTDIAVNDDTDITVDIHVDGDPEAIAEKVLMHAHDEAVRALQAFEKGQHPNECEGVGFSVAWDRVLDEGADG